MSAGSTLETLRAGGWVHHALQVGGAAAGIALAWVHWSGFLLGGALVGLLAWNVRRAVLAGVAVGVLGWTVFAGWVLLNGALGVYVTAGQPLAVSLLIAPALGGIGGLARGLF